MTRRFASLGPATVPSALRFFFLVAASVAASACHSAPPAAAPPDDLHVLVSWMTGTFSSAAQHEARPADYFDIRLVMVPIWPERADGPWLYVEQAVAASAEKPYRQRVYHVHALSGDAFQSDVFTLPGDPLAFAGAWRDPQRLAALTPAQLAERRGCSIQLQRVDAHTFAGATHERDCPSERQGAAYATSEVVITERGLASWDRGFDAEGNRVWGAEKGAYSFDKLSQSPPP